MILVTGATGTIGGYLVAQLCEQGVKTRALVRSPEKADALRGYGCETSVGSFEDPASLDRALDGVTRVFLASPASPQQVDLERNLVEAARRRRGAVHVVKLAAAGVDGAPSHLRLVQNHQAVVESLQGVPHTVLAPNGFLQNLLGLAAVIQQQGALPSLTGDARISFVDGRDVAAVAVHVLTSDGHDGATYTITGPAAVSEPEIARTLSSLVGRTIGVADLTADQFRAALSALPSWNVEAIIELNEHYRTGALADVTDEVEKATGTPARSVEEFLSDHLSAFR